MHWRILLRDLRDLTLLKRFNIFHSLSIAFVLHVIFFLFLESFAAAFFESSSSMHRMRPPDKEIKFIFVPPEPVKKEPPKVSKKEPSKMRSPSRARKKRPIIMPEKKIPPPVESPGRWKEEKGVSIPPPIVREETPSEKGVVRQEEGQKLKRGQKMMDQDQKLLEKESDQKERRIPVIRRDLLRDFFVNPPESSSKNRFGGEFRLEGGLFPNLTFETKDFDWTDYATVIYWAIWRSWHNRLYLTLNNFERWTVEHRTPLIEGVTGVTFVIEKNGNISEIVPLFSSGIEPLDVSAMDALREVILPPLPSDFPKERERVRARFIADTDIKAMKYWLPIFKREGHF